MRALLLLCVTVAGARAGEPGYEEIFDPFHPAFPLTGDRLPRKREAFDRVAAKEGLVPLVKRMRLWEGVVAAAKERIDRDLATYREAGEKWWGFKRAYAESYRKKHGIDPAESPIPPNNDDFLDKEKALKVSQSLLRRERDFHAWVERRAAEILGSLEPAAREKVLSALAAGLKDRNPHQAVRCAELLGSRKDEKAAELLARAAASERDPVVLAAMLRAYARAEPGGVAETLAPRLGHAAWPVRAAAVRGLEEARAVATVDLLVGRFAEERGRVLDDLAHALRALTLRPLGGDGRAWAEWWAGARDGFAVPPAPAPPELDLSRSPGVPSDGPLALFGVATRSERLLFCLDGRLASQWKEEVARCIEAIPDGGAFAIVVFGERAKPWRKKVAESMAANRKAAADWVRQVEDERAGDVLLGAEAALALADGGKDAAPLLDTMYLVTAPANEGFAIHDPGQVAQEIVAKNRILGLRIHPLGPSGPGHAWWLQTIARPFDGVYNP